MVEDQYWSPRNARLMSKLSVDTTTLGGKLHEECKSAAKRPRRKSFSKLKKTDTVFHQVESAENEEVPERDEWPDELKTETDDESKAMN